MGIANNINDSEKNLSGYSLYTGIARVKVLAINPNKEWIEAHGFRGEGNYTETKTDEKGKFNSLRLDIYVQGLDEGFENLKSKITNFINPCYKRWRKTSPRYSYADVNYLVVESNFNLIL